MKFIKYADWIQKVDKIELAIKTNLHSVALWSAFRIQRVAIRPQALRFYVTQSKFKTLPNQYLFHAYWIVVGYG